MCISVNPFNGCIVIWPDSRSDDEECACDCGTIVECSCFDSTGYIVQVNESLASRELQICWINLTEDKNLTRVFVASETRYISEDNTTSNPISIRTYHSAYVVIIAGMQLAIIYYRACGY